MFMDSSRSKMAGDFLDVLFVDGKAQADFYAGGLAVANAVHGLVGRRLSRLGNDR
jgi:phage terminase large subunit-like protein